MAWIAKPSGTQRIERRVEPYLTSALKAKWSSELLPKYATKHGALMPILHEIQHEHRCIPYQAMLEIAAFLGLTPADVLDTVTFYDEFTTNKMGDCVIGVCQSVVCEACGHKKLLDHIRHRLELEPRETTDDGRFTLLTMECLGSCDTAPVALFNDVLHEQLTIEKVDQLIDSAKAAPATRHHT